MTARPGRITARLAEPECPVRPELVHKINRNINPPSPVEASDVHIRAMYVVSDQVNSFGGRFPVSEHRRLADLLVDSPVLAGHRKDKLPLGRTFHAEPVTVDGVRWVKAYFYWLRSANGAESLRENIDGGVYKECSIGFTFSFAECSICGEDIRLCEHEPLESYGSGDDASTCHFNYRKIERVLETSLVYRGATPGTSVTRELADVSGRAPEESDSPLVTVGSLSDLPAVDRYLIIPHYDSLHCRLSRDERGLTCEVPDYSELTQALHDAVPPTRLILSGESRDARLVGYRGKERCSRSELIDHLRGEQSPVRRLVWHLLPRTEGTTTNRAPRPGEAVRIIPYRFCTRGNLVSSAREIMTASGIEVCPLGTNDPPRFHLTSVQLIETDGDRYRLIHARPNEPAYLAVRFNGGDVVLRLRQFHAARLLKGARFIAESYPSLPECARSHSPVASGPVKDCQIRGEALTIQLEGPLAGMYRVRPANIGNDSRLLVYRVGSQGRKGESHVD